ncbi:restriction endonuclease subunit S [Aeromonas caviae]|uniref:restriction endonuclease subunit S n=1 Tax=Aeromonas caviae TaxID=648 RepID=UPI0021D2D4CF|nr:restriction endonuclease subunit S [Aeromonas caviae]MCU7793919.1 restriction endonuclease subunit S [Aeromonas caviae]
MSEVVATAQQGLAGKYPPYPEYKDSGVVWLGDVPEHWVLSRVKDVAVVFGGYPFDSQRFSPDVGVPLIRIRDINTELTAVYFDGDVPQEAIVENNDVLIGMDGEFNVARWKGGKAALNQRVACVRTDSDELTTLLFYTLPFSLKVVNDLTYYTTVKHLSLEDIKKTIFALPQGEELSNIVAFLDYETARIDRLIAQQQRLIELLKEKRQAVISHAITKGLNPNAPMKDSGVEWLGQVPEHWGVSALGYYSMLNTGATPDRSKNQYWGGTIPWIKTGEVRYDTIYETEETITQAALSETSVRLSKPGTLLMAMYGQGITRGRVAILGVSATYNQACVAITPNSKLTNDFLKFFFMAGYDALRDGGNETSQMNLNADIVSKFKVLVPSYEEQIDIVSFLRIKLAHYEQLINKSEHAIALMQERRTALISAAVTGKIDLRGWEPPAEEAAA